eukprot:NODE_25993_length_568_cov_4.371882.p4 GENE.NODE_25993_length_568_cov_4.371882~~NODE_25993_length_568_cov_4.371882.p4  ORF type:complete len:60 (-),score=25.27 NODE_25993_length_568_cov_4.371882:131-310(-)
MWCMSDVAAHEWSSYCILLVERLSVRWPLRSRQHANLVQISLDLHKKKKKKKKKKKPYF